MGLGPRLCNHCMSEDNVLSGMAKGGGKEWCLRCKRTPVGPYIGSLMIEVGRVHSKYIPETSDYAIPDELEKYAVSNILFFPGDYYVKKVFDAGAPFSLISNVNSNLRGEFIHIMEGWTCGPVNKEDGEVPVSWQMSDGGTDFGSLNVKDLGLRLVWDKCLTVEGMNRFARYFCDYSYKPSEYNYNPAEKICDLSKILGEKFGKFVFYNSNGEELDLD